MSVYLSQPFELWQNVHSSEYDYTLINDPPQYRVGKWKKIVTQQCAFPELLTIASLFATRIEQFEANEDNYKTLKAITDYLVVRLSNAIASSKTHYTLSKLLHGSPEEATAEKFFKTFARLRLCMSHTLVTKEQTLKNDRTLARAPNPGIYYATTIENGEWKLVGVPLRFPKSDYML